jgi:hypothetical protein
MGGKKEKIKKTGIKFLQVNEELISESVISDDFEIFIEYAKKNQIELSKSGVISIDDCKKINSLLSFKIIVPYSRPLPKSFPNIINLFILFRISGMGELTSNGKRTFLKVNTDLYDQWHNFSGIEKYFNLLALALDHFSLEFVNERSSVFSNRGSRLIYEILDKKKLVYDKKNTYYFDYFHYRCFWVLYSQFGFVNVNFFEPEEGKKTIIESVSLTDWGKVFLPNIILFNTKLDYYDLYDDSEYEGIFKDYFTKALPQIKNWFKIPDVKTADGIYIFEVKLGPAKRTIAIDSALELDDLCVFILECFDFDYDHMYMVELKDRFGQTIEYNGCPDMSYAEGPTTDEVTIGELSLKPGSKMEYTYDFGDNWMFEIILVTISPKTKADKKKLELIKSTGKAPKQYRYWDEDEEE